MGNSNNDIYLTETPDAAAAAYKKRAYAYCWIDSNIGSQQNRIYLQALRNVAQITPIDRWEAFPPSLGLLASSNQQHKICVICSASLPENAYLWLQQQKRVNRVVIFCGSEEQGIQLKQSYNKIVKVFTMIEQLSGQILQLEQEDRESIYFFCQQEMGRLNRWMSNWFTLQQDVIREKGFKDFKQFMTVLLPNSLDLRRFQSSYNINKILSDRQTMVLEWIKANNFYFQTTAGLLAKIRDTFILALIRMPFFDIYSTIKTTYIQKNYDDTVAYTLISLNCHEMNRLQTGCFKYIYFSTFLICQPETGRRNIYKNEFKCILHFKQRSKDTDWMEYGGFFLDQNTHRVFLNVDNPFQVLSIDLEQRQIVLQLIHVPRMDVEPSNPLFSLQLHRKFIRYLARTIPGQILPSYFNEQLSVHQQFVNRQIRYLLDVTNADINARRVIRKVELAKLKLYFHIHSNKESIEVIQKELLEAKELSKKMTIHYDPIKAKIKIYFLLTEINLRTGDFQKLGKCTLRLKQLYDQHPDDYSQEEVRMMKLYRIYCYVSTNKTEIQENLQMAMQIQVEVNTRMRQCSGVSQLYFLICVVKIKCYELLFNYKKVYSLFDQLIKNVKISQGQSQVYFYIKQHQLETNLRQRRIINDRQKEEQKKRITSEVAMQQLSSDPYAIHFSIDSQVFKSINDSQYLV